MDKLEIKAALSVSDAGEITGIAWPFGTPDSVGDVIRKGAFTIAPALPMLFEHDPNKVVGAWESVTETDEGLQVKGRLYLDGVPRAREVRDRMRAGRVNGLSIGFRTLEHKQRPDGRDLTAVYLAECSIVANPSHPGARVLSIKSADGAASPKDKIMSNENTAAAPELAALETKMAEVADTVKTFAKITERVDRLEAKFNRPSAANSNVPAADNDDERKAFASYLRHGKDANALELKALTVSSDPQAGYLAPAEMSTEFIRDLIEFSPIRSYASVRSTASPSVKYPRRTGITNAQWEDELEESEESTMGFGLLEVPVHKVTTFIDISNELLSDSGGAAEAEVRLALAEDFGLKEAVGFVGGSGIKQPEGLMTHADIGHTVNGHATNLGADKLIDLLYALPAAYRNGAGAAWAMNGSTLAAVRKLKDGQNNYLWQPAFQAGQPETILGKPVIEMKDMPDIADGAFPIIFGDFSGYRILDRLALAILSDPYTQARKGVTRIHATRRVGGRVLQAARFRKLKTATA